MSNSQFINPIIVRDSRIQDITNKLDFKLQKSAAQNNYQSFPASTATANTLTFNINVPSPDIIIDREVTITATTQTELRLTGAIGVLFNYGSSDSFSQFPLNSLFLSNSYKINGATSTVNTQDLMGPLMKMSDDTKLNKYNTPTMGDKFFKHFSDMVENSASPLKNFNASLKGSIPRGSHPIHFSIVKTPNGAAPDAAVTHLDTDGEISAALTTAHANDVIVITIISTFTEPLLFCSPFLYGNESNSRGGLYGIRKLDFTMQLDNTCKRMFSSAISDASTITAKLISVSECELNLNMLTAQTSDLIANENVLPFNQFTRNLTNNFGTIAGQVVATGVYETKTLVCQSVQMAQIPDRIYICVRKRVDELTPRDSNWFLPITKLSINFNNVNGILSGANANDLYNMSVENGSQQERYEFTGLASIENGRQKPTSGSLIVINPSRDLNLPDMLTNGSQGQFNFACTVTCFNNDVLPITPEITIIEEHQGVIHTVNGETKTYTGLYIADTVISETARQFGESENYIKSFDKNLLINNGGSLKNIPLLNQNKNKLVDKSGGAYTGGAYTGGQRQYSSMLSSVI